jgi:hypothetical protein
VVDPVAELLERSMPFTVAIARGDALELAWSRTATLSETVLEDGVRRERPKCACLLEGVLFPREN